MQRLAVIASFLVVCCLGAVPRLRIPRLDGRIVGGWDAEIGEAPHQVSMQQQDVHICGASIISSDWVVTAAQCADGLYPGIIFFRAGSSRRDSGGSLHKAARVVLHPQYDFHNFDYDVAVIKVEYPFGFGSNIAAISLPRSEPLAGTIGTVSGWGTTVSGGSLSDQLQSVDVPIVDRKKCNVLYASFRGITERMICAGYDEGGKDACQGDSGGALVIKGKLIGIVSWGIGCATPGYPGVYTNVASVKSFITSITGVS